MNIDKEIVPPLNIFYSYAPEDIELRNELNKHLSALRRRGLISEWYDRDIQAGSDWRYEADVRLEAAHIILLLISSDFMHSDYCYSVEMNHALRRLRSGEVRIIPIILRSVDWEGTPIAPLSVLPSGGIPIMSWQNRDEAFSDVAKSIRKIIELDGPRLTKTLSTMRKKENKIQNNDFYQLTSNKKDEAPTNILSENIQSKRDADHISQTLNNLANQIGVYDYGTKVQLRSLSGAVSVGKNIDVWKATDIYKAIDVDMVIERFKSHHQFTKTTIKRLAEFFILAMKVYIPAIFLIPTFAIFHALMLMTVLLQKIIQLALNHFCFCGYEDLEG